MAQFLRAMGGVAFPLLFAFSALAQYPGQVSAKPKNTPQLRAVAVLEWTGEAGKPKACRLVPVSVYDGEALNDATVYLARPEPLALAGEVEYQLKQDGKTIGLFDIKNAGQEQGSWVGYGDWKSLPDARPAPAAPPKIDAEDDEDDDKPILHRKHHDDDTASNTGSGTAPQDSDRPVLHKSPDAGGNSSDSDRPVLHKSPDAETDSSATTPSDPDRPVLKKPKPAAAPAANPGDDTAHVTSLPTISDTDRPRLVRGKSTAENLKVVPSLMGLPPDMQQAVAVSDAQNRPDHPWTYTWANPADEDKMKAALEAIARQALGLNPPPPPPPAKKPAAARKKAAQPAAPPQPAPLEEEQFRVFELAYGSGATMVLSAHTPGPLAQQKFVTLIAQPDLYGNVLVLLKSVTDGDHLDETPRMRLVDAVDALADNRGELLFELRGDTSRQFALYRVLRGRADKIFASGGNIYGSPTTE